jgi:hypothetical protein
MKIYPPMFISSRLLAAIRVGDSTISIDHLERENDGRDRYQFFIDAPSFIYTSSKLRTGRQGGNHQEAMKSLIAFLLAASEHQSSNFPKHVNEWAFQNEMFLQECSLELEEKILIEN